MQQIADGQLTGGEMGLMIGAAIFGFLVFGATVWGVVRFFKRIEREDKAEEERFSENPTNSKP